MGLTKLWVMLALVGLVSGGIFGGVRAWQHEREARTIAELALVTQKQVNDSTVARLTFERASADSLSGLLAAAKELNGKLIAGAKLHIPARDTQVVHDTVPTIREPDSSRVATFKDSTFAGYIEGRVVAPPYPSPLGISYTLTRPAFSPSVGFVQIGDRFAAVVVWQGEHVQVEAPYVLPEPKHLGPLGGFVQLDRVLGQGEWVAQAGGVLRAFWGLSGQVSVQQSVLGSALGNTRVLAGVRKEF